MEEIKIGQKLYFIENDVIVEWEVINKNPNNTRFLILISGEIIRQVHWKDIIYGIQYNTCPETLVKTYEENVLARIDKLKKALKIENKKENPISVLDLRKRFKKENPDKSVYVCGGDYHTSSYVIWLQEQLINNALNKHAEVEKKLADK